MNSLMILSRDLNGKKSGRVCVLKTVDRIISEGSRTVFKVGFFDGANIEIKRASYIIMLYNFIKFFIFKGFSLSEIILYNQLYNKKLKDFIYEHKINFIYVDSIRLYLYVKEFANDSSISVHMDFDDRLSTRYKNLANKEVVDVLGFYSHNFPKFFTSIFTFFSPLIFRIESRRLFKREFVVSKEVDSCSFVSEREASNFNRQFDGNSYFLPMAVDVVSKQFVYNKKHEGNDELNLFFLGDMTYQGNINSLDNIVSNFREVIDSYGLSIVGSYKNEFVSKYSHLNISFLGYIDNLESVFDEYSVMFIPMDDNGGIKTKVLDAFSLGIPVITNINGVDGLNVVNRKQLIIANSSVEVFQGIDYIKKHRDFLVNNAQDYLVNNFSFKVVSSKWESLFNNVSEIDECH